MRKFVIEASKDGKKWEEIHEISSPIYSPSEPINVKVWKFIRIRIVEGNP